MLILKFLSLLLVLIFSTKNSHEFKWNIFINMSKIEDIKTEIIATYKTFFIGSAFPLHPKLNWSFSLKEIVGSNSSEDIVFGSRIFVKIKIGNKTWNAEMQPIRPLREICDEVSMVYEIQMDNFLNQRFKCQNQVTGYISLFYFSHYHNSVRYYRDDESGAEFGQRGSIYWMITKTGHFLQNNELNFVKFLRECRSIPQEIYLYIFGSAIVIIIILVLLIFWFVSKNAARKNVLFPIITVRQARQVNVNVN